MRTGQPLLDDPQPRRWRGHRILTLQLVRVFQEYGASVALEGAPLAGPTFLRFPVTSRAQAGKIVQQSPLGGGKAPQNAQVLVFLGAFRAQ